MDSAKGSRGAQVPHRGVGPGAASGSASGRGWVQALSAPSSLLLIGATAAAATSLYLFFWPQGAGERENARDPMSLDTARLIQLKLKALFQAIAAGMSSVWNRFPHDTHPCLLAPTCTGDKDAAASIMLETPAVVHAHRSDDKATALCMAAQEGFEAVVAMLLERGAGVNSTDERGASALSYAASRGKKLCLNMLLEAGASSSASLKGTGHQALHLAAGAGHTAAVRLLLKFGAPISPQTVDGTTPLMMAAEGGHLDVVRELLLAGSCSTMADARGYTALHRGVLAQSEQTVAAILSVAACEYAAFTDPGARSSSPLALAAATGNRAVAAVMVEAGAGPTEASPCPLLDCEYKCETTTPLHIAAACGHTGVVQDLVASASAAAPPTQPSAASPAHPSPWACCPDGDGLTPLMVAVQCGRRATVAQLVMAEADSVNLQTVGGRRSALHLAAAAGGALRPPGCDARLHIVQDLLAMGADVNCEDGAGATPLHLACAAVWRDGVAVLLGAGADATRADAAGRRCADLVSAMQGAVIKGEVPAHDSSVDVSALSAALVDIAALLGRAAGT